MYLGAKRRHINTLPFPFLSPMVQERRRSAVFLLSVANPSSLLLYNNSTGSCQSHSASRSKLLYDHARRFQSPFSSAYLNNLVMFYTGYTLKHVNYDHRQQDPPLFVQQQPSPADVHSEYSESAERMSGTTCLPLSDALTLMPLSDNHSTHIF